MWQKDQQFIQQMNYNLTATIVKNVPPLQESMIYDEEEQQVQDNHIIDKKHLKSKSDYEYKEFLGKGSWGSVNLYHCKKDNNKVVAIKSIRIEGKTVEEKDSLKKQILKQIKTLISINHDQFAKCLGCIDESPDEILYIMEYFENGNVNQYLEKKQQNEIDLKVFIQNLFDQMLAALVYLQQKFLISHCNIKPENILVKDDYQFVLTDFGMISLQSDTSISINGQKTGEKARDIMKTLKFLPPELVQKYKNKNNQINMYYNFQKSDLFSLGLVIFYIFNREILSFQKNPLEFNMQMKKILQNPSFPHQLTEIAEVITNFNYKQRPTLFQVQVLQYKQQMTEQSNKLSQQKQQLEAQHEEQKQQQQLIQNVHEEKKNEFEEYNLQIMHKILTQSKEYINDVNIFEQHKKLNYLKQIENIVEKSKTEQLQISLLIFGDISVGKTTFINALLCELLQMHQPIQILPFKSRETTKWILKIKESKKQQILLEIFYEDNNEQPEQHIFQNFEDLKIFYKNLEQQKIKINYIDLYLPFKKHSNLQIIDSPGINKEKVKQKIQEIISKENFSILCYLKGLNQEDEEIEYVSNFLKTIREKNQFPNIKHQLWLIITKEDEFAKQHERYKNLPEIQQKECQLEQQNNFENFIQETQNQWNQYSDNLVFMTSYFIMPLGYFFDKSISQNHENIQTKTQKLFKGLLDDINNFQQQIQKQLLIQNFYQELQPIFEEVLHDEKDTHQAIQHSILQYESRNFKSYLRNQILGILLSYQQWIETFIEEFEIYIKCCEPNKKEISKKLKEQIPNLSELLNKISKKSFQQVQNFEISTIAQYREVLMDMWQKEIKSQLQQQYFCHLDTFLTNNMKMSKSSILNVQNQTDKVNINQIKNQQIFGEQWLSEKFQKTSWNKHINLDQQEFQNLKEFQIVSDQWSKGLCNPYTHLNQAVCLEGDSQIFDYFLKKSIQPSQQQEFCLEVQSAVLMTLFFEKKGWIQDQIHQYKLLIINNLERIIDQIISKHLDNSIIDEIIFIKNSLQFQEQDDQTCLFSQLNIEQLNYNEHKIWLKNMLKKFKLEEIEKINQQEDDAEEDDEQIQGMKIQVDN